MPNTLGLDDDLDSVELVRDLEKAFEIKIANDEAERLLTVGQLYDLLLNKIPTDDAQHKCASAMTFYRMRSAIRNLGPANHLVPASQINFLEVVGLRSSFKKIERVSGLRLPRPAMTYIGGTGCLFMLTAFVAAFGLGWFFDLPLLSVPIGACVASVFLGYAVLRFDPGKLPKGCATLGELTHKTVALNYGKLVRMGAHHSSDTLWDNLLELLSGYRLPKSEITRDTFFVQSQLQKHAG